jgi:predicted permease
MLHDLRLRLRSVFRRDVVERELDEELTFHLEQQIAVFEAQGLPHDEAIRRARIIVGGFDQIKEAHRDARGIAAVDDLARDLRYAMRQVRRSPGFALLAMLCLGLGIGVNTTIFSVASAVLFRSMPVPDADRLVTIGRGEDGGFLFRDFFDLQARARLLSGLTTSFPMESDLDVDGTSEFVTAEVVPANYAQVFGVTMSLGRWFADDREPVAVISHAVWQRRFNLRTDVLGRRINSESQSYTIVGVAPPSFSGALAPLRTDLWVPLRTRPFLADDIDKPSNQWRVRTLFGRLAPDVTVAAAAAELNAMAPVPAAGDRSAERAQSPVVVERVHGLLDAGFRRRTGVLMTLLGGVVGLVLLIACVNVGNLLLVRGAIRQREFGVRRALGASQARLLRQLLSETLILAAGGGVCGVILAGWTNRLLETSVPAAFGSFAIQLGLDVDWRTLAFAAAISVVTTVLCGLWPAWRTSRGATLLSFKGEIGAGPARRRPISLVAQVVMSLVLLFVAGSFVQALLRLQSLDPGFAIDRRLYAYAFMPATTPEARRVFHARVLEVVRAMPGVRSASLTSVLPLMPIGSECAATPDGTEVRATTSDVDTGYFATMGIDLLTGRDFLSADRSGGVRPVIISQSVARRLWSEGSAIGQRLTVGCKTPEPSVVIGTVRDAAIAALDGSPQPHVYRLLNGEHAGLVAVVAEATGNPSDMTRPIRESLLAFGQGVRVYAVQPLAVHVRQRYAPFEWLAGVLSGFGTLALVLAAVGLYGVIAYRVALRTQELGVRMALGATRQDIFREVLRDGLVIVGVGVAIGEVLTTTLTLVVGSAIEGIQPAGVATHVAVGLIWIVVALAACLTPAARAARIDPLAALRHE